MLICEKYKIESDNLNVTLYRKSVAKHGEVYWRPIACFAMLSAALKHLVDLEVMETELKDFRAVVEKQEELYHLVDRLNLADKCCGV